MMAYNDGALLAPASAHVHATGPGELPVLVGVKVGTPLSVGRSEIRFFFFDQIETYLALPGTLNSPEGTFAVPGN